MTYLRSELIIIWLLFLSGGSVFAQLGLSHEVGVLVGPTSFFTDYGERYNFKNNVNNSGIGIGLVHYMNFAYRADCNCYARETYFNDHFKVRTEIDYFRTKLEHFGPIAAKPKSVGGILLRAMHGETQTFEIGTSLEYYPRSIRDYRAFSHLFSPFISLGIHYVNYFPKAYSDLGPITDENNLFPTFRNGGVDLDSGSTWAIVGIAGTRFRLGHSSDLNLEARWQYYNTDWLEGLNVQGPQNKFNDLVFWVNVGYIYYINF